MTWSDCLRYLQDDHASFPAATERYAQTLWVLAEALSVRAVLEIGVGPTAVSGCTFIHSMGSRGGGKLVSFDIDESRPAEKYRDLAFAMNVDWKQMYGDSLTTLTPRSGFQFDLIDGLFDLVYVDGDHDEAHAYSDTVKAVTYLRPGGYLVIDDYPTDVGVVAAADRLRAEGYTFVHVAHEPPHGNGRLIWQKP